jgi:hypothetical protein
MAIPSVLLALRRGHAFANCIPVSKVNQGTAEDDDGTKAETDGTGTTSEELNKRPD